MVRAKGHKELLTPAELADLNGQKRELEDSLKERKSYGAGTQAEQLDTGKIQQQINRIDKAIADREPRKITGLEKDAMVREAIELEEKLKEGLPTRDEMDKPSKNPGAVRKHMRWLDRNQANIERWRYIQRIINPYDPKSVENLRKEK
jgi:hypothetical protein